jgi:methionyl aminopeptidase
MNPPPFSSNDRYVTTPEGRIPLHQEADFEAMRRAGKLASEVLDYITPFVKPGITTGELDERCHTFIVEKGAIPAPLNYKGFPKSICTSVNQVVCHGIPGETFLKNGDILNIDVTVILEGWHGDTSRMFCIGPVPPNVQNLVQTTYDAMMAAIEMIKPGVALGDLGATMEEIARKQNFSVSRDYCGHGIGRVFHAPPAVLSYGRRGAGIQLEEGMFFTVEPIFNLGKAQTKVLGDGWTVVTTDKKPSAQWEHTVGVTGSGYEIFTLS